METLLEKVPPNELQDPTPLPEGYEPRTNDICCGRGKRNWNHQGNVYFRSLVQANVDRYVDAPSKTDKTTVVLSIVERVRQEGSYFVKQDDKGSWYDIGDAQAREKVGHSLRDQVTALKKLKKQQGDDDSFDDIGPTAVSKSKSHTSSAAPSPVASGISALSTSTASKPMGLAPVSELNAHHEADQTLATDGSSNPDNPYGYNTYPSSIHSRNELHHHYTQGVSQGDGNDQHVGRGMLQRYSSEPMRNNSIKVYAQMVSAEETQNEAEKAFDRHIQQTQNEPHIMDPEEHQWNASHQVIEKFARRSSWRATSINSVSAKQMVQDMTSLRDLEYEEEEEDEFDQEIKQIAFSVGGSSTTSRRRSSLMRFSMTSSTFEERRLSAMSIGSLPMNGSFTDIGDGTYGNVFRSSIRRSSVAWMSEMQQAMLEGDMQHFIDEDNSNSASTGNRRVSAIDMLKAMDESSDSHQ